MTPSHTPKESEMTSIERRRLAMLERVRDFGEIHKGLFPKSSVGGQAFGAVGEAVAGLRRSALSKVSTARDGNGAVARTRDALVAQLEIIGLTARGIAEDTEGFDI